MTSVALLKEPQPRTMRQMYGWDGPGTRGTRNRRHNDQRKANQTMLSSMISASGLVAKLLPEKLNPKAQKVVPDIEERLAPYDKDFIARSCAITRVMNEAGGDRKKLRQVKRLTDVFLKDVENVMRREGLFRTCVVPGWLLTIYRDRCNAFWLLCNLEAMGLDGEERDTTNTQKYLTACVLDATNGHTLACLRNTDDYLVNSTTIICLMTRGKALHAMKDLDAAMPDFRAVCAAIRGQGDDWKQGPTIQEATDYLLRTLVEQNLRDKSPRPHYSKEERVHLERELGLGIYSNSEYKCANCSKRRTSSSVKLSLCSKCKQRWFCCNDCIREAWYSFHKQECKELRKCLGSVGTMSDEAVACARECVKLDGYVTMACRRGSTGLSYIMWDAEKEEYFDSVTDGKVELTTTPHLHSNLSG